MAELLAKNGTIGAPPVGGRRRRRRGNADAVTVAELTGEIPIIRPDEPAPAPVEELPAEDIAEEAPSNGAAPPAEPEAEPEAEAEPDEPAAADDTDDEYADVVAEYSARVEERGAEPGAEQMSPDPIVDAGPEVDADTLLDAAEEAEAGEVDDLDSAAVEADLQGEGTDPDAVDIAGDDDGLPSYLRSSSEPLFGGQTVADDLARRAGSIRTDEDAGVTAVAEEDLDADRATDLAPDSERARPMSSVVHGAWIVGQSVLAVVFGAGLFVAFDQLWKWNNIVALVLSVLVILGLVVGVRVVRKTEDIGSTLIAVAVGALVTLGPLALLQSG